MAAQCHANIGILIQIKSTVFLSKVANAAIGLTSMMIIMIIQTDFLAYCKRTNHISHGDGSRKEKNSRRTKNSRQNLFFVWLIRCANRQRMCWLHVMDRSDDVNRQIQLDNGFSIHSEFRYYRK